MALLKNKFIWIIFSIFALIFLAIMVMPKPINMNLDKIGNGLQSVVFVYDPNITVSNQQTTQINKAREIIGDKVNFLIVNIGDPQTDIFKRQYNVSASELLFFNGNGELIDRRIALLSAETLIKSLN